MSKRQPWMLCLRLCASHVFCDSQPNNWWWWLLHFIFGIIAIMMMTELSVDLTETSAAFRRTASIVSVNLWVLGVGSNVRTLLTFIAHRSLEMCCWLDSLGAHLWAMFVACILSIMKWHVTLPLPLAENTALSKLVSVVRRIRTDLERKMNSITFKYSPQIECLHLPCVPWHPSTDGLTAYLQNAKAYFPLRWECHSVL